MVALGLSWVCMGPSKYLIELTTTTEELSRSREDSRVDNAYLSQPLCTAVQLALVELLKSFGIAPSVVVGHSSGEIAAA